MPLAVASNISFTASYIPAIITNEGTIAGRWEVSSASGITDTEIISLVNSIASLELSSIGGTIVDSVMSKIQEMRDEFDAL